MNVSTEWVPPEIPSSELTYAITSSVVEEFAHGHAISDVLRELVQNEYDAGGTALEIEFGEEGFHVRGTGKAIDRAGWQRLSVMLGTGRVAGEDRQIRPKINGIGSKNHGIRSLFLIGDRIHVRSAGLQTALDLNDGALRAPIPDPVPPLSGVHVYVPYRRTRNGRLEPYAREREKRDLDGLSEQLAPTLIKLAQPGVSRSVRRVTVRSIRHGRTLVWNQRVTGVGRHRLGGPIVRREIGLDAGTFEPATKIVELEYQKPYQIPESHRALAFPAYFRVRGGRVNLAVSIRLERNRPDARHRGSFYYPLGVAQMKTGCAVSLSAPFEMDSDRTALAARGESREFD